MITGMETVVSYFPDARVTADDYAYLRPTTPSWMTMPREKRRDYRIYRIY